MKNIIIILALLVSPFVLSAQENQGIKRDTIHVAGNCGDCKERIENAALINGVKFAEWNKDTKQLIVVYKEEKVTKEEIERSVASAGHDAGAMPSDSTAYQKLPGCCQYKTHSCSHGH